MRDLVTPTWSASPQGSGTVEIKPSEVRPIPAWPEGHSQYRDYTYTAKEAKGYRFVRFEFKWTVSHSQAGMEQKDTPYEQAVAVSPYATDAATLPIYDIPGVAWSYDYNFGGMERFDINDWVSELKVVAVFEKIARVPTHLLVNSSDREAPARLVHDPKTNLLVADW